MWGVRGRALSHPRPLVRSGARLGPTTHWLWVRGMRAWGPVTNPTARTLASWLCPLWGRHEGARGGRLVPGCGASGVAPSPTPDHSSFRVCGRGPLPTGCGCGGCGRGDPSPTPQCALLRASFARCGGGTRAPEGGASCLGVGCLRTGALPAPTSRPFGRAAGAHYPLTVAAGAAGIWTRHQPHSARSCALWGRHEGARGGCLLLGFRASGVGRSPTPDLSSVRACGRGPLPTGCRSGGCGCGDPSPPPQRALLRAGFARRGRCTRALGGGRSLPGCGASGDGRSPSPDLLFVRACGRGPLLTGCGCGGCGHGDLSPTPQRALLQAGFARCGGGMRVPGGGASCLRVGRPGDGRSPTPDVSSVRACGWGPLPTGCGCGGCGLGDPSPTPQRALLRAGFARCGGGMRVHGGGASCLGVGRPGSRPLPPPTTRPLGCAAGAHYPLVVGAGGAGVGTRHQCHSARLCEPAVRAVGAARGRPGGAPLAWVWGVCGRALPHHRPLVRSGVRPGPTTHWLWLRGLRALRPVTNSTVRALASWLCALLGRHAGARGGRLLPGSWASRDGHSPTPDLSSVRACGRGPLPTGCGCGGCGHEDPSRTPQRALLRAGFARCGGGMRVPGGGASCLGVGRPEAGALPHPTSRPFSVRPGPTTHWLWVRGVRASGPVTNPTARALACCGGGMRVPGGGASCLAVGRPVSGALPAPTSRPFGRAAGAHYQLAVGAGGAGARTRHQPHSARSCELALRAVGAARGRPGGAPLAWVRGVRGRALSHPRPLRLSGVRPGPASHWLWVRCLGVGARLSLAPCPVPRFVVCCARFPGSRHPMAVVAWHLSPWHGCGRRRASLACLVAPRWCAAPRPVRLLSVLRLAFLSPWCLPPPRGLWPPALLGDCAGHVEAGRELGSLCLPLAPAEARALGALRVVPVRGPAMGLSLAGPSGFGLGLRALRWLGVCGPGH